LAGAPNPGRTGAARLSPKDEPGVETRQPELVLDIGTHKVLALAVEPRDEGIAVLASAFLRHPERSMRDGQVHDVAAVARTVRRAVEHVSRAVGVEFAGAHIAAAGRALKTARGGAERSEPQPVLITPALADMLEWEAVADAQRQLLESLPAAEREKGFYCIAHAVVESRLDGDVIGSLANQRGRVFSVEVLATFLPAVVVDSLEAVLAEAGLEMRSLTLEPVAALEAVIPPTMRHLNLALVDIGAGTSDIALTGGGTIRAFAMVPRGGDAITEAVSEAYLLDFPVAELAKRTASAGTWPPWKTCWGKRSKSARASWKPPHGRRRSGWPKTSPRPCAPGPKSERPTRCCWWEAAAIRPACRRRWRAASGWMNGASPCGTGGPCGPPWAKSSWRGPT
jgi:Actin-like ATPase involved in cell division